MSNALKGLLTLMITLGLGFALGLGLGWKLYQPKPSSQSAKAEPEKRQEDGSLILEVKPDTSAKPPQQIPKGAKVERIVNVVVQPKASAEVQAPTSGEPQQDKASPTDGKTPCPQVQIDLTMVRMKDQSRRVIASSPDGEVIGGMDIPVESPPAIKQTKWGAGGLYRLTQSGNAMGVWVDRDFGPFRTSVELARSSSRGVYGWEAGGRLGIRW